MFLLINPSQKDEIHLFLFDEEKRVDKTFSGPNRELLFCIDKFLREQKLTKEDVAGIMVVVGAGSFTSTRIATVAANAFAYAHQISVLAIAKEQADGVQALIPELLKQPVGQYLSATYSGEANITVSR
ncbi:MAG: hypothetical protein A3C90_00535 [Candidatus Magasanikbacteria bacterium RIFCSPHIGHO2_02_FULL_51_14]|uniref:Gcp-like domain-containing protein n=1 Tax=Candidatus Magasanikbacteria bacterium RIFCSPHIGHO2_02_FULL_51_14 TaxID=1798683 RepID=A0A1F6MI08_9BACT|nr:MAG: hypothetical protein A3C90_00535 [Candidatus Magasanikbacteria bacterium RIFCSPHIGHO2_02_FULL_51_14]